MSRTLQCKKHHSLAYQNVGRWRGQNSYLSRNEPADWRVGGHNESMTTLYHQGSVETFPPYVPPFRAADTRRYFNEEVIPSPANKRPRPHSKISFGIILTQINPITKRPEAILVRGRYSYEYAEFVHGKYAQKNIRAVSALLDAMSINERLDIYSLNFNQMWYRIWLTAKRSEHYNKKFAKFQTAWMRDDNGEYLRRLVQASSTNPGFCQQQSGGVRWEFPKGRRLSNREPDLNCAIREFEEETGIAKQDYQILPGFKRRVSYIHMGVRYVNVYYIAIARRRLTPYIDLKSLDQVAEIFEVRWMDIEQIRLIDTPTHRLETTVSPVFNYVKRYVRGLVPTHNLSFRMTPCGNDAEDEIFIDALSHFEKLRHQAVYTLPPTVHDTGSRTWIAHCGSNFKYKDDPPTRFSPIKLMCEEHNTLVSREPTNSTNDRPFPDNRTPKRKKRGGKSHRGETMGNN